MGHIWLIGMMGTGKTTVGVLVAERLGRPFIDIDSSIMEHTGRTIPELFADSEEVFRRAESDQIETASLSSPAVIATGGGAILLATNVEIMRSTGTTVLLTAPVDVIVGRIGTDTNRPLARSEEALEALAELRMATYLASSDHAVDTASRLPGDIAEEVIACVAT